MIGFTAYIRYIFASQNSRRGKSKHILGCPNEFTVLRLWEYKQSAR